MAVKEYSLSKLGRNHKVSEHFTLGVFVSPRDKVDIVKIDDRLLDMLEKLRAILGGDGIATIGVPSGYRSPAYNRSIGGASQSRHTYGDAADVVCKQNGKRISGKLICCLCQDLGFAGVALNKGSGYSVHLDMRPSGTYRGDERYGYGNNVGGNFYSYFGITKAQVEALKVNVPEESEEDEMIYKDITEVPEWGLAAVRLRLDHGWTDGKNITESMLRNWVVEDRENPYIADIGDVPTWAVPEVQALIDAGKIKGNGVETIGKRWQVIESVIIGNR